MIFRHKRKAALTGGERALDRIEKKQPEVDRLVYVLTKRLEQNHFGESIEKLMGQKS